MSIGSWSPSVPNSSPITLMGTEQTNGTLADIRLKQPQILYNSEIPGEATLRIMA